MSMPALAASHRPTAASTAAASMRVTTCQIVLFDGTAGGLPHRAYTAASIADGVSVTHPAIAVNPRIPATTAAAHKTSTAANGWTTHEG